jgi:hypothetical protein
LRARDTAFGLCFAAVLSAMRTPLQLIALVLFPAALAAQGARVSFPPPPNAGQAVLLSLRSLARAEEQFLETRMRYAPSTDSLRYSPEPGVTVVVISATQRGWSAKGMWDKSPGRSCVVYFGYTTDVKPPITDFEGRRPKREGEPVCDPM